MPRGKVSKFGRTDGIRLVAFRVSADERATLEADAKEHGISVNELARRRALAGDVGVPRATEQREVRVEYDQEIR